MIQVRKSTAVLAAAIAAIALTTAGCNRTANDTTGRATSDKMATTTDKTASTSNRSTTTGTTGATSGSTTETGAHVDDAALTTKVKTAVLAEPGLKSTQINVDTKDAVVTLSGTVDNPEMKSRAVQIAQGVQGVKSVNDNLSVKTG
jgi:hyperosmotically inducible protein